MLNRLRHGEILMKKHDLVIRKVAVNAVAASLLLVRPIHFGFRLTRGLPHIFQMIGRAILAVVGAVSSRAQFLFDPAQKFYDLDLPSR